MYKTIVRKKAQKSFNKLSEKNQKQVKEKLIGLSECDPNSFPGSISMSGKWQSYRRFRIGK